jgi:hypothetical protein
MTDAELQAFAELSSGEAERDLALEAFEQRLEQRRQAAAAAQDDARSSAQVLLRGAGEALVEEVDRTLTLLGFHVENQDEVNPPTDLLEDLLILDPNDPSWSAIAEVRFLLQGRPDRGPPRLARFESRFVHSIRISIRAEEGESAGQALVHRQPLLAGRPGVASATTCDQSGRRGDVRDR